MGITKIFAINTLDDFYLWQLGGDNNTITILSIPQSVCVITQISSGKCVCKSGSHVFWFVIVERGIHVRCINHKETSLSLFLSLSLSLSMRNGATNLCVILFAVNFVFNVQISYYRIILVQFKIVFNGCNRCCMLNSWNFTTHTYIHIHANPSAHNDFRRTLPFMNLFY